VTSAARTSPGYAPSGVRADAGRPDGDRHVWRDGRAAVPTSNE
jgi:hypothetical protein